MQRGIFDRSYPSHVHLLDIQISSSTRYYRKNIYVFYEVQKKKYLGRCLKLRQDIGRADLSKEIYVKLIQQIDLSAKLWQAVSVVNEAEHTAIKLSKAITATKIEYKMV